MLLKIFTSRITPEGAVEQANRCTINMHKNGYEAVRVQISEKNDFWDGYGEYTVKVWYQELKEKATLRKLKCVHHRYSQQDAVNCLERITKDYVDMDTYECNSFWAGEEISGIVLF